MKLYCSHLDHLPSGNEWPEEVPVYTIYKGFALCKNHFEKTAFKDDLDRKENK
jgi:hypothetical protein